MAELGASKKLWVPVRVAISLRILIIEDETFIAELCRSFLQKEGHAVTLASNGQRGLDSYMDNLDTGTPFDVVITDYRMPIKDGAQVITEIFSVKPDQRIVLATAYSIDFIRETAIGKDKVPILQKPFSFDELAKIIAMPAA